MAESGNQSPVSSIEIMDEDPQPSSPAPLPPISSFDCYEDEERIKANTIFLIKYVVHHILVCFWHKDHPNYKVFLSFGNCHFDSVAIRAADYIYERLANSAKYDLKNMDACKTRTINKKVAMMVATGFIAAIREFNLVQFQWLLERTYSKLNAAASLVMEKKLKLSTLTFVNEYSEPFYKRVKITRHIKARQFSLSTAQYWDEESFFDTDEIFSFSMEDSSYWTSLFPF